MLYPSKPTKITHYRITMVNSLGKIHHTQIIEVERLPYMHAQAAAQGCVLNFRPASEDEELEYLVARF